MHWSSVFDLASTWSNDRGVEFIVMMFVTAATAAATATATSMFLVLLLCWFSCSVGQQYVSIYKGDRDDSMMSVYEDLVLLKSILTSLFIYRLISALLLICLIEVLCFSILMLTRMVTIQHYKYILRNAHDGCQNQWSKSVCSFFFHFRNNSSVSRFY